MIKYFQHKFNKYFAGHTDSNSREKLSERMYKPFMIPTNTERKTSTKPDYIGIGFTKCGTSWWHQLILQHPQVEPNILGLKELNYFIHFNYGTLTPEQQQNYKSVFPSSSPNKISGEWTPSYIFYPHTLQAICAINPSCKIIVILRNPVDRTISHINQILSKRIKSIELKEDERYLLYRHSVIPEAYFTSLYDIHISNLLNCFKKNQILILLYEELVASPKYWIEKTYEFLNIDANFSPNRLDTEVNKRAYIIPIPTPEERKVIGSYFSNSVANLKTILPEYNFNIWKDFN